MHVLAPIVSMFLTALAANLCADSCTYLLEILLLVHKL